jgi:hypothetical protein
MPIATPVAGRAEFVRLRRRDQRRGEMIARQDLRRVPGQPGLMQDGGDHDGVRRHRGDRHRRFRPDAATVAAEADGQGKRRGDVRPAGGGRDRGDGARGARRPQAMEVEQRAVLVEQHEVDVTDDGAEGDAGHGELGA